MSTFHVLLDLLSEVLLDDRDLSEWHLRVGVVLYILQHARQHGEGVISRVRDQKGQVDEFVRVRQVAEVREEHRQVRGGIAQRGAHQDALSALPSLLGALDLGEVIVTNGLEVQIIRRGEQA